MEVDHYRCYKVYIYNTRAEYISDTVGFFPANTTMTDIYSAGTSTHVETDYINTLKNPAPASPFVPLGTVKID